MSLNLDSVKEILGHVDGITLANAGCVSSEFWCIAKQESMWEDLCCSLWPSVGDKDVKELISSSLGGFRKFYGSCYPLIAYEGEKSLLDGDLELSSAVPSDFVSVVDVRCKNKVIFSKVVLGFPDDIDDWFCNCSFRMDLISSSGDEETSPGTFNDQRKDGEFSAKLMDDIRLSWILINKRTGEAANLSSWRPLSVQKHCPSDKDFVIRFGSILPAHNILPCGVVQCIVEIKCRGNFDNGDNGSLKITELSMQVEDMMGTHVNGRNSLLILERALGCRRSKDHTRILESYRKCSTEQCESRETKMRNRVDSVFILSGVVAFATFWYFVSVERVTILGL